MKPKSRPCRMRKRTHERRENKRMFFPTRLAADGLPRERLESIRDYIAETQPANIVNALT